MWPRRKVAAISAMTAEWYHTVALTAKAGTWVTKATPSGAANRAVAIGTGGAMKKNKSKDLLFHFRHPILRSWTGTTELGLGSVIPSNGASPSWK
jgi:hypothetical protein